MSVWFLGRSISFDTLLQSFQFLCDNYDLNVMIYKTETGDYSNCDMTLRRQKATVN